MQRSPEFFFVQGTEIGGAFFPDLCVKIEEIAVCFGLRERKHGVFEMKVFLLRVGKKHAVHDRDGGRLFVFPGYGFSGCSHNVHS